MSPRTLYLGKLLGLYCILISLSMATHKQTTVEAVTGLVHNPPLLFLAGVIGVVAGLALIIGHNVWSGGALPIAVTLVGWLALTKGLVILFLSSEAAAEFFLERLHYEEFYYWYAAASFLLGIYLTYGTSRVNAR